MRGVWLPGLEVLPRVLGIVSGFPALHSDLGLLLFSLLLLSISNHLAQAVLFGGGSGLYIVLQGGGHVHVCTLCVCPPTRTIPCLHLAI